MPVSRMPLLSPPLLASYNVYSTLGPRHGSLQTDAYYQCCCLFAICMSFTQSRARVGLKQIPFQGSIPQSIYVLRAYAFTGATNVSLAICLSSYCGYLVVVFWFSFEKLGVFEEAFLVLGRTGCFRNFPHRYNNYAVSLPARPEITFLIKN